MKVTKRGKKYQYDFSFEGKRYRKLGFRSSRDAKYHGERHLLELMQGFKFDEKLTVKEYFKRWCETHKKPVVSKKLMYLIVQP